MILQIITPEKMIFEGEVELVTLPGKNGNFQLLNNHAPIVSTLTNGVLTFTTNQTVESKWLEKNGNQYSFTINGGIIELNHNQLIVLAPASFS